MRYIYMFLVIVFTLLVVSLMVLNLQSVTLSLYATSVTTPLSFLVLAIYVLGMLTGGFVVSLLRTWVQRATRRSS